jgi:hypothetical protein
MKLLPHRKAIKRVEIVYRKINAQCNVISLSSIKSYGRG